MKKFLPFVLIALLASCSDPFNKAQKMHDQLINEDLGSLLHTDFGMRGENELWTYHVNDTSSVVWIYHPAKDSFEYSQEVINAAGNAMISADPKKYFRDLLDKKKEFGI